MNSKVIVNFLTVYLLGIFSIFACETHQSNLGNKAEYHRASKELIRAINQSNNSENIIKKAIEVTNLASPILKDLVKKNKKCGEIVDFIEKKKDSLFTLTPSELEEQYHEGSALPKFPEECHDLKELIVHPATVVSLAKFSPDLKKVKERMKDEIEEVLMHFEAL